MKTLFLILFFAVSVAAQLPSNAVVPRYFPSGSITFPCDPATRTRPLLVYRASDAAVFKCTAADTWTNIEDLAVGDAVTGGGANRVLFQDASQNLTTNASFIYTTANGLAADTAYAGNIGFGSTFAAFGHVTALASFTNTSFALGQSNTGATIVNHATGTDLTFRRNNVTQATMDSGGRWGFGITPDATVHLFIQPFAADDYGLVVRGFTAQTAPLFELQTSSPTTVFGVEANGDTSIGHDTPSAALHVIKTTEQLRLGFDTSNHFATTVASNGATTFNATGAGQAFTFSDSVSVPNVSGTGNFALVNSPTFVTPVLGAASATSINLGSSTVTDILTGTASLDYAQALANTCETLDVTSVTGAADGDTVEIGVPNALAAHNTTATFFPWVSASATISVRRCVISADGSDPAAATVRTTVTRF